MDGTAWLTDMQQLLTQEMQVRAAADERLSSQIAELNSQKMSDQLAELKLLLEAEVDDSHSKSHDNNHAHISSLSM